jgi:hypothetical protein
MRYGVAFSGLLFDLVVKIVPSRQSLAGKRSLRNLIDHPKLVFEIDDGVISRPHEAVPPTSQ